MTIVCASCETAQFLQITASRVCFGLGGDLEEIDEWFECTLCGATGSYAYHDGSGELAGDVSASRDGQPAMLDAVEEVDS